jgi:hypothetical protein
MAEPKKPEKVKIFCGFLYKEQDVYVRALSRLQERFGPVDIESDSIPFTFSSYYEDEMGPGLKRRYASFASYLEPEEVWKWKLFTNQLEQEFSSVPDLPSRQINIDPGYVTLSSVILLTTKGFYHRIYLSSGIYAEVTLRWHSKRFEVFPWTYPDYATEHAFKFFEAVREKLRAGRL